MATPQNTGAQQGETQSAAGASGPVSSQSAPGAQSSPGTQSSQAAAGSSSQTTTTPSDREARVPMSREGTSGQTSGGSGITRQQQGSMAMSPFTVMQSLFNDMDRMFGGALPTTSLLSSLVGGRQRNRGMYRQQQSGAAQEALWAPPVDISRRDDQLVVTVELAGINPDDVTVEIDDNALIISGEREAQVGDQNYTERIYGAFYRAIPLPDNIDPSQVTAVFRNGVLEVSMPVPKQQQDQGRRRVKVQS